MPFDDGGNRARVEFLRKRGVDVWGPERVYVSEDVNLDAIEAGAVIRHATLSGPTLRIAAGAVIGTSGHAEVDSCQIGRNVELGSGLYHGATLLEGVKIRGFAEIRPNTLLEEQADLAHCVALKNTTFTCCCVAGSLINFCDLFLSGGTSRRDHTEIGSGVIHYNFDPRGDKWGSLLGSIRGVLMQSDPVFIGGTCGLVGPLEIGLGAVTAAGSIVRKDVGENELVAEAGTRVRRKGFDRFAYGSLRRRFLATAKMVGTLRALDAWYSSVRLPHARPDEEPLYDAARRRISRQVDERIGRLGKIIAKLSQRHGQNAGSLLSEHHFLIERWDTLRRLLSKPIDQGTPPPAFLEPYAETRIAGRGHVAAVKAAHQGADVAGKWLESLVALVVTRATQILDRRGVGPS